MRRPVWTAIALVLALGAGCDIMDFRSPSDLGEEPQILTIVAAPAEARPGDHVRLSALVHWPSGNWEAHWLVCLPEEGDWTGTCVQNHFPADGEIPPCSATPSGSLCRAPTGVDTALDVPAGLPLPEGVIYPILVELVAVRASVGWAGCADAAANAAPTPDCLIALKTLPLSSSGRVNQNPVIAELTVDGTSMDATPVPPTPTVGTPGTSLKGVEARIRVSVDASSVDELRAEDGTWTDASIAVDWYVTCGSILPVEEGGFEGDTIECEPPDGTAPATCSVATAKLTPDTPGDCMVYVVLRDDYGGHAYRAQPLRGVGEAVPEEPDDDGGCGCGQGGAGRIPLGLPLLLLLWGWRRAPRLR